MIHCDDEASTLLIATETGYGKRTKIGDFRKSGRGVQGVIAIQCSQRNGNVVAVTKASDQDDFFLITDAGTIIRMEAACVPVIGRNTQGLKLMNLEQGASKVVSCQVLEPIDEVVVDAGVDNSGTVVPGSQVDNAEDFSQLNNQDGDDG
jgi:DNA gyrase subunit A